MNYGRAIKILRASGDVSQKRLASLTKLDASYISLIETGKRSPSLKVLEAIAAALDTPLYLLILLATPQEKSHLDEFEGIWSPFLKRFLK